MQQVTGMLRTVPPWLIYLGGAAWATFLFWQGATGRMGPEPIKALEHAYGEAALIALRNITGQRFGYEPDARQADRDRKVDQWRSWWRREGDDFLSGGGA